MCCDMVKKSLKILKGVIRNRLLKKERQDNEQKKNDIRTNNDMQNSSYSTKDWATRTTEKKPGFNFAWNWIIVAFGEALFAVKKKTKLMYHFIKRENSRYENMKHFCLSQISFKESWFHCRCLSKSHHCVQIVKPLKLYKYEAYNLSTDPCTVKPEFRGHIWNKENGLLRQMIS